ncbi:MAG: hypothetical protein ABIL05_00560 [candidate division WOR-3 bacterium]
MKNFTVRAVAQHIKSRISAPVGVSYELPLQDSKQIQIYQTPDPINLLKTKSVASIFKMLNVEGEKWQRLN